jgi:hypothetical protein
MILSSPVIMRAKMRGSDERNEALFSYVNLEDRVPARPSTAAPPGMLAMR